MCAPHVQHDHQDQHQQRQVDEQIRQRRSPRHARHPKSTAAPSAKRTLTSCGAALPWWPRDRALRKNGTGTAIA